MDHPAESSAPSRSSDIVERLLAVAREHSVLRSDRAAAIGWTVASRMPAWSAEDPALITGRQCFWMFAVDDLSDDASLDDGVVAARFDHYRAIIRGDQPPDADERARLLAGIVGDLRARPLWPLIGPCWQDAAVRLLDAMQGERDSRPLTLADYLERGTWSVGVPVDAWVLALLLADGSVVDRLPAYGSAILAGARVVRLANDIATAARERGEGKAGLFTLLDGRPNPEAAALRLLTQAKRAWRRALAAAGDGRFVECFTAGVEVMVEIYRCADYHTFDAADQTAIVTTSRDATAAYRRSS